MRQKNLNYLFAIPLVLVSSTLSAGTMDCSLMEGTEESSTTARKPAPQLGVTFEGDVTDLAKFEIISVRTPTQSLIINGMEFVTEGQFYALCDSERNPYSDDIFSAACKALPVWKERSEEDVILTMRSGDLTHFQNGLFKSPDEKWTFEENSARIKLQMDGLNGITIERRAFYLGNVSQVRLGV
jgi:hypothetical protein